MLNEIIELVEFLDSVSATRQVFNKCYLFGDLGKVTLCNYPNLTKKMKSVIAPN